MYVNDEEALDLTLEKVGVATGVIQNTRNDHPVPVEGLFSFQLLPPAAAKTAGLTPEQRQAELDAMLTVWDADPSVRELRADREPDGKLAITPVRRGTQA